MNLLSVFSLMVKRHYKIIRENKKLQFIHDDKVQFTATVNENNIGYLDGRTINQDTICANAATTVPQSRTLWNRRLSQKNHKDITIMLRNNSVTGIEIIDKSPADPLCVPCVLGKQRRHAVPKASDTLAMIHADLKGPLPRSHNGYRYWLIFVDNSGQTRFVYFLQSKDETAAAFESFLIWAERITRKQLLVFHNDKGGKFISRQILDFCNKRGICCKFTETGEPYQNGVAECANLDISNSASTLLNEAKLPMTFWPEAVSTCVHTFNRLHTSALFPGKTPYSKWYGKKPDVSYFRVLVALRMCSFRTQSATLHFNHIRVHVSLLGTQHKNIARNFMILLHKHS